jgi:hypothetical protein
MSTQAPTRPTAPTATGTPPIVDAVDQAIFSEEIRQFVKEKEGIVAAMKGLYSAIWGQCSETLRSRLKSNSDHMAISAAADSLKLLKAIRAEMTGFKKLHYLPHSVHSIMREFYQLAQGKHHTNHEYYDEFNNVVAAVDDCGAMIAMHPTIYQEVLSEIVVDPANPTANEKSEAQKVGRERYLAVTFLLGADSIRYGMMIEEIENECLRNRDESSKVGSFPLTIANAYEYLENYKKNPRSLQRLMGQIDSGSSGMAFLQTMTRKSAKSAPHPIDSSQQQPKSHLPAASPTHKRRLLSQPAAQKLSAGDVGTRITSHQNVKPQMKSVPPTNPPRVETSAIVSSSAPP